MFATPWFWFFAPQVHFPWSGSVAQHIAPDTHWFFGGIAPDAGDARVEEQAFGVASYGRQLGLITEALLDLSAQSPPSTPEGRQAVARLRDIRDRIERIKGAEQERGAADVAAQVQRVLARGGPQARALEARLRALLEPAP